MNNGKILKIRLGHEANCSSGMVLIAMLFVSGVTHLPTAVIASAVQGYQARRKGEVSQKAMWIPQVIGLVFTAAMFIYGVVSGYSATYLGIMVLVLGAVFALAVYIGSRLAPKIGYWNILAVPLIQVGLVYLLLLLVFA